MGSVFLKTLSEKNRDTDNTIVLASSDSMCPPQAGYLVHDHPVVIGCVLCRTKSSSVFSALNFKRFVAANVGDAASTRVEVEALWPRLQCISL